MEIKYFKNVTIKHAIIIKGIKKIVMDFIKDSLL